MPGGERWRRWRRRADPGARANRAGVRKVWPGRMSRIFPGRRKPGGGGASLASIAVSGFPKLILNLNYLWSDGAGVYIRSCVTGIG